MSTHANVIVKMQDGTFRRIHNQYDGDTLGDRLRAGYQTQEAAEALVNQGDASFIGTSMDPRGKDEYGDVHSEFYHRDRGETKKVEFSATLRPGWFDVEYAYIWTGTEWHTAKAGFRSMLDLPTQYAY